MCVQPRRGSGAGQGRGLRRAGGPDEGGGAAGERAGVPGGAGKNWVGGRLEACAEILASVSVA